MKLAQVNSLTTGQRKQDKTSFGSAALLANPALTGFLRYLDTEKMMGVGFTDTVATNVPRTVTDTKEVNIFAGIETCIREFSGLLVNCFSGGFLALGAAHLLKGNINENYGIKATDVWANTETIDVFTDIYKKKNADANPLKSFFTELLNGNDALKKSGKIDELADDFLNALGKSDEKLSKEAVGKISAKIGTVLAGEAEDLTLNLSNKTIKMPIEDLVKDGLSMGKVFNSPKVNLKNLDQVAGSLKKLVKGKSFVGMAAVLAIASSIQYLNRLNTKRIAGKDGAPIHKNFTNKNFKHELTDKDKTQLKIGKVAAVAGMIGISALSIAMGGKGGKLIDFARLKPKNLAKMLEFKSKLPSVDQCRVVATATFASRMLAAEDKSELKKSTMRDYFSFINLYFIGEHISRFIANVAGGKKADALNANGTLKSHNQVLHKFFNKLEMNPVDYIGKNGKMQVKRAITDISKKVGDEANKSFAAINKAQLAGLGFTIAALGLVLPKALNKMVEAEDAKEAAKRAVAQPQPEQMNLEPKVETSNTTMTGASAEMQDIFKEFTV